MNIIKQQYSLQIMLYNLFIKSGKITEQMKDKTEKIKEIERKLMLKNHI